MSAENLEMMEFLFARTSADYALRSQDRDRIQTHMRESLRLHRFQIFGWLIENGVRLPVDLVADHTHPEVGKQRPDKTE